MYRRYVKLLADGGSLPSTPASKDTTDSVYTKDTKDTTTIITTTTESEYSWGYVEYFYGPERDRKHTWEVDYERECDKRKRDRKRGRGKKRKGCGKNRSRSRSGSKGRKGSKDRRKSRSRSRSGSKGRKGSKDRRKSRSRSRSRSRSKGRKGSKDRRKGRSRSRSRSRSRNRKGSKDRRKGRSRSRSRSRSRNKKGSKDRRKGRSRSRSRSRSRNRKGSKDRRKSRSRSRSRSRNRRGSKERRKSKSRSRSRSSSREPSPKPKPKPKPKPPKEVELKGITVKGVDTHVEKNTLKHRTDRYNCVEKNFEKTALPELVLRRGDTFLITIQFDRKYDKKADDLTIVFSFGEKPIPSKGTMAEIQVDESSEEKTVPPNKWGAQLKWQDNSSATIEISIPANCIVGVWDMALKTHIVGEDKKCITKTYDLPDDVVVLFNPWCKHDSVYMEKQEELNEYVLNDTGCVYRGNSSTVGAKEWNFGQFENPCFEAALYLLRQGCKRMSPSTMSDPIRVSRIISKMVNCQDDDNGVLVGNWSGDYDGGKSPTSWVGSVKILAQYMDTKEPVMFGQCWVFSCLTTTVCRALGIPCRSVTCFASAHDHDQSNTIDKMYLINDKTKSMELDKYRTTDSVWNFHVWNETWMSRPDLGSAEYDGWQVIDATPQEASDGVYQCGPSPVKAIKAGNCSVDYDTGFVFSEVNADRISWLNDGNSTTVLGKETNAIGKKISTKVADGLAYKDTGSRFVPNLSEKKRLDLTGEYKFAEGTSEEREAVLLAYKTAINPRSNAYDNMNIRPKPLELDIVHSYEVKIGSDLDFEVVIKNPGKSDRVVEKLEVRVAPESYTGDTGAVFVSKDYTNITVASNGEHRERLVVPCTEYLKHSVTFAMFYIEATGTVDIERDRPLVAFDNFRFRRPDIDVESSGKGKIGEPVEFTLSFENTLPVPLTKCDVSAESSYGFKNILDVPQDDVPVGGTFKTTLLVTPMKKGLQTVLFSFDCKELKDISGSETVNVE